VILAGLLVLVAGPVASASATLTIETPRSGTTSKITRPSFAGSTAELIEPVTVQIYEGESTTGTLVQTLGPAAPTPGGEWTVQAGTLTDGTYTAKAEQPESGGIGPALESNTVTFTVNTQPPTVTLNQPTSPSNNRKPVFSGTASETSNVVVAVFEGTTEVASASTTASEGSWSAGALSSELPTGKRTYTAVAKEESLLGNSEGESNTVTFTVDTTSPVVALNKPASPSKDRTPAFTGSASASTEVVVHIHEGATEEGPEVSKATAAGTEGAWTSGDASPALAAGNHTYTAVATQGSPLGNPEGKSSPVTFTVNTAAPTVTLNQPASPSNERKPSFSGSASEDSKVVVHVFEGTTEVGSVSTTASGGSWSSGALSTELPAGDHTYTAVAKEESLLGNAEGESATRTFAVDTEPPPVSLNQPETPSSDRTPSFNGTAGANTEVVVHIYEGTKAEGGEVSKATASGTEGAWTSSDASPALATGEHTYTAVATQRSPLGNPEGVSPPVTFTVDTHSPVVTLSQPASPTNDRTPLFVGSASASTPVVVHIFEGATEVSKATATEPEGEWTSGVASPALATGEHTYTAYATQKSPLGNLEGKSGTVTFTVDSAPPTVTLSQPASPTNKRKPSFSGNASEDSKVVVRVYEGTTQVATATTTAAAGSWSAGPVSPELPAGDHTYTAVAKEESLLGNLEGESATRTFTVDTSPPTVTLNQPASPSNDRKPSFSGKASENSKVIVHVFEGTTEVASVSTTASGGSWASGALSSELAAGDHTYTAVAKEESLLGNPEGESVVATFTVDTLPPTVSLSQPASPSSDRTPTFSGSATASTEVVVHIYEGTTAGGTEVAKATASGTEGAWTSGAASPALATGEHTYTAVATQKSPLGNPEGASGQVTFTVNTNPPAVTLTESSVSKESNDRKPTFSGTASASSEVVVHVYEGTKPEGTEVAKATAAGTEGAWTSGAVTPELAAVKHVYTAIATQTSPIGNGEGRSKPVTFTVNTEPPTVTLSEESVAKLSNNRKPAFTGYSNVSTEVVVHVYEGTKAEGTEVTKATAKGNSGDWTAGAVSPELPAGNHTFTAVATEVSPLGNPEGRSNTYTFTVDTEPPSVKLNGVPTPSSSRKPAFTGESNASTEVVVHIYEGSTEVAKATATGTGGSWKAGAVSPELPAGDHSYTAVATESSPLGNLEGVSNRVSFTVNTEPPTVKLTEVPKLSNNRKPAFTGESSASTEVVVHVYEGSEAKGTEVAKATAKGTEGAWTAGALSAELAAGIHTYTAIATEASPLGNLEGKSSPVTFTVDTEPPKVELKEESVAKRSNVRDPVFSGTSNTAEPEVVVHIYEGATEVAKATAKVSEGSWKTAALSPELPTGNHSYTATATQASPLGNAEGRSKTVSFTVDTEPPKVELNPPPEVSGDKTPSFSGTSSESGVVTVSVYAGSNVEGKPLTKAGAEVKEGKWTTGAVTLANGTYTAVASEPSAIGNEQGVSNRAEFRIETGAPTLEIKQPPSPSKDTTPAFTGTSTEKTDEITVKIYAGSQTGQIVSEAKATGALSWNSTDASPALADGTYTAVASQSSSLGNGTGQSNPVKFVVDTKPPTVTLNKPTSPSNDRDPAFAGKASEQSKVVVHVYEGTKPEGTEVAKASGSGTASGTWTAGAVSAELPIGEHTYTAVAKEESLAGNAEGVSETVTFTVDTESPKVELNPLPSPSTNGSPAFSGTASDHTPVTVKIYAGGKPEGTVVATAGAEGDGGEWHSGKTSAVLTNGQYTAQATQPSSIGNPEGGSQPVSFTLEERPPTVRTEGASSITRSAATMSAIVDPNGGTLSTCHLEYGTTAAYGSSAECAFVTSASAECPFVAEATGACEFPLAGAITVYARVFGLAAGTSYHYRVVTADEGGPGDGADATFTTLARAEVTKGSSEVLGKKEVSATCKLTLASTRVTTPQGNFAALKLKWTGTGTSTCGGGAKLTVKTKTKGKHTKTTVIGIASFSLKGTAATTVNVRLSKTGHALLKADHGKMSVGLALTKLLPGPAEAKNLTIQLIPEPRKAATKAKK
jgi:hypothetical protein